MVDPAKFPGARKRLAFAAQGIRMIQNRAKKKRSAGPAISTCRDEIALIGDYLTNNLSESDRTAFAAHLSACRDCNAFLATYKKTIELTRSFLSARAHSQPLRPLQLRR